MRLRRDCRTHRQTPPQKRHWNLPPAPTPEAPAKKPAKPEAPAPRPTRRQAAAMSAAEMGLIDDAELDAIIEEFGSKHPPL